MKNDQIIKITILTISAITILFSISYAFINIRLVGEKKQVLSAGELSLELEEDENNLTIENALPMYDEVGMIQEPFTFHVINNSSVPLNYIVRLIDITTREKLDTSIVKHGLTIDKENKIDFLSNLENGQVDNGIISSKQTIHYSLRLWLDSSVEDNTLINNKSLSYRIEIEAGQMEGTERNIVLDSAGGTLDIASKSVIVGEPYGSLPTSIKTGYNFLGWFNEKGEVIHEDSILDSFTEKLTAKWGVNQYTVTLNANGGTVSPNNKQINFNDAYGNLPTPKKGDSKFLGWYTAFSGGTKIESTTVMNSANNHTLYAHWKDPYVDNTGASRPVIKDELIPVTIAANGTVTKADIYEEWYDYNNKEWANAVILLDKTKNYSEGQTIPESNIESYFVWIPRYKYKIFNAGNYSNANGPLNANAPQTIEIEFEDKSTTPSKGTTVGSWLSHPAFQAFDSNGFWVGKFESGYKDATTTTEAEVNSSDSSKLQIKSNVYSWRNVTLGNMFKISYDYKRNLESHMMKNTEWGAVAYLSHSQYGKQDENGKNTEVYINNNSAGLTGCGGDTVSDAVNTACKNSYNSKTSNIYNQSTTGNISGIFDMSGGSLEYVMGNNNKTVGKSEITTIYNNFFTDSKWDKYYDRYLNTSKTVYNNRILGDATGEMGPFHTNSQSSWYDDFSYFVYFDYPWFSRGGICESASSAGIFNFDSYSGINGNFGSFRVVLAP